MALEPGIHAQVPFASYCDIEAINFSRLKLIADCPETFRCAEIQEEDEEDAEKDFDTFGRAYHTSFLEPRLFKEEFLICPKMIRRGKAWDEEVQKAAGRQIIFDTEAEKVRDMLLKLKQHSSYDNIFKGSNRELTVLWYKEGILCKARIDLFNQNLNLAADLKSTIDCTPDKFTKRIFDYKYDQQMAWYTEALAANGITISSFLILAQRKSRPYGMCQYELTSEVLSSARKENDKLFATYKACRKSNIWPSYPDVVTKVSIPDYIATKRGIKKGTKNVFRD